MTNASLHLRRAGRGVAPLVVYDAHDLADAAAAAGFHGATPGSDERFRPRTAALAEHLSSWQRVMASHLQRRLTSVAARSPGPGRVRAEGVKVSRHRRPRRSDGPAASSRRTRRGSSARPTEQVKRNQGVGTRLLRERLQPLPARVVAGTEERLDPWIAAISECLRHQTGLRHGGPSSPTPNTWNAAASRSLTAGPPSPASSNVLCLGSCLSSPSIARQALMAATWTVAGPLGRSTPGSPPH
jgi:hypothetical protein